MLDSCYATALYCCNVANIHGITAYLLIFSYIYLLGYKWYDRIFLFCLYFLLLKIVNNFDGCVTFPRCACFYMEKILKIFIIFVTLLGTWFQCSEYSETYFGNTSDAYIHIIGGEEYLLLVDYFETQDSVEEWIDDLHRTRRNSFQQSLNVSFSKDALANFLAAFLPNSFKERLFLLENTSPKQLLGYGLLYLQCLF